MNKQMWLPVGLVTCIAFGFAYQIFTPDNRFSYHPMFFLVGVLALSLNSVTVVQTTRLTTVAVRCSTWLFLLYFCFACRNFQAHVAMQVGAAFCMLCGFYAIYTNKVLIFWLRFSWKFEIHFFLGVKDILQKPHFWSSEASWHAHIGGFSILAFFANVVYSLVLGIRRVKGNRSLHKKIGIAIQLTLCGTMVLGTTASGTHHIQKFSVFIFTCLFVFRSHQLAWCANFLLLPRPFCHRPRPRPRNRLQMAFGFCYKARCAWSCA